MTKELTNYDGARGALPAVPSDLAEWLGAVRLVRECLSAVQDICLPVTTRALGDPNSEQNDRTLLTVWVYALGRGWSDSAEVERRVVSDPGLRYLSANRRPSAFGLRQFRRSQTAAIVTGLSNLLLRCWDTPSECLTSESFRPLALARLREAYFVESAVAED